MGTIKITLRLGMPSRLYYHHIVLKPWYGAQGALQKYESHDQVIPIRMAL